MKSSILLIPLASMLFLPACAGDGTTTQEMKSAAIERARQELSLPADTPLEAMVWTGKPYEDQIILCGTVSSPEGAASPIRPYRFAANSDPIEFRTFEAAHSPSIPAQTEKFVSWTELCAGTQAA